MGIIGVIGGVALSWWAFVRPLLTCNLRLEPETSKRIMEGILKNASWQFVINNHHVTNPRVPEVYESFVSLNGCLFYFSRAERLMTAGWQGKDSISQIIFLRWQSKKIHAMLRNASPKDAVVVKIMNCTGGEKLGDIDIDPNAETFLEPSVYEDIEADVVKVLDGEKSKTSMLLYGKPGSGKTQFVKYLARKYAIPINVVYFNPDYNNQDIAIMFSVIQQRCIVLMEDFDTLFDGRECAMKNDQVRFTFDSIINALDGVHNDYKQVIFVMTANDITRIDDSLKKRPSRFKFVKELGSPSRETRMRILKDESAVLATEGMTLDDVFQYEKLQKTAEQIAA